MLTEAEAKTKWCPFARATVYVRGDLGDGKEPVNLAGHGCNRILTDDPKITANLQSCIDELGATRCIASNCMAWHSANRTDLDSNGEEIITLRGYCGMVR